MYFTEQEQLEWEKWVEAHEQEIEEEAERQQIEWEKWYAQKMNWTDREDWG